MSKLSYLLFLLNLYTAQLSEAAKDIFQVKLGQLETLINTGQLETLSLVLANDGALVSCKNRFREQMVIFKISFRR